MKATYPIPAERVSAFVQGILVIENYQSTNLFELPLFANGTPTLLFQTKREILSAGSNFLTLFGQTVFPDKLFIKEDFTQMVQIRNNTKAKLFRSCSGWLDGNGPGPGGQ